MSFLTWARRRSASRAVTVSTCCQMRRVVDAVRGLFPCLVPEVGGLLGFGGVEGEAFPPGDAHLPCAGVGGLCLAGDGGRYPVLAHDGVLSCVVDRLSGYPLFFLFGLSVKRSVTGQSGFRPIDRAGRSPSAWRFDGFRDAGMIVSASAEKAEKGKPGAAPLWGRSFF